MESLYHFVAPPSQCGYLPHETWSLEYDIVQSATAADYGLRMANGWRRFGRAMFRPQCLGCQKCQPIRVVVDQFRPDRSQRRARQANEGIVELRIGQPQVSPAKLDLYDRFHAFQSNAKGWPEHPAKDAESYINSYVDNPFRTEEWCYYLGSRLVGVGYVDVLPGAMSAIYFFYDPAERQRSLGTWNLLSILDVAAQRGVPHVYLGYYVEGCKSMEYKAKFRPNEVRGIDGVWRIFRE
ncbi:MAG TPA: arginyltransferase [Gemmataceae bacterium]|nr:arginyltransferase [Gemmataceae bacterium]